MFFKEFFLKKEENNNLKPSKLKEKINEKKIKEEKEISQKEIEKYSQLMDVKKFKPEQILTGDLSCLPDILNYPGLKKIIKDNPQKTEEIKQIVKKTFLQTIEREINNFFKNKENYLKSKGLNKTNVLLIKKNLLKLISDQFDLVLFYGYDLILRFKTVKESFILEINKKIKEIEEAEKDIKNFENLIENILSSEKKPIEREILYLRENLNKEICFKIIHDPFGKPLYLINFEFEINEKLKNYPFEFEKALQYLDKLMVDFYKIKDEKFSSKIKKFLTDKEYRDKLINFYVKKTNKKEIENAYSNLKEKSKKLEESIQNILNLPSSFLKKLWNFEKWKEIFKVSLSSEELKQLGSSEESFFEFLNEKINFNKPSKLKEVLENMFKFLKEKEKIIENQKEEKIKILKKVRDLLMEIENKKAFFSNLKDVYKLNQFELK